MPEELEPKNVDKRVAERHIRAGKLDEKNWEKYNKALPDVGEKAIAVESTMSDDFDDVDEDDDDDSEE